MRFILGFITALTLTWAALAIWNKLPVIEQIEPDANPDIDKVLDRIYR